MRLRLLFALAGLGLAGCNTPSVPLPPPDLPALTFQSPAVGTIDLTGKPTPRHADALFFVQNRSRGNGVIQQAGADGAFTTEPFGGGDGDEVQIYYQQNTRISDSVLCTVKVGAQLGSATCQ